MAKEKIAKKAPVAKPAKKTVGEGETITTEIAQHYLKDPNAVDLGAFTELDAKAAAILRKSKRYLKLNGVTRLSEAAAEGLGQFKGGSLELNALAEVIDAVAQSRVTARSWLSLKGVTFIPDSLARILATHSYWLSLNGVASLPDGAAQGSKSGY